MKKMFLKLTSLLCLVAIVLSCVSTAVFANDVVFDLYSLGILDNSDYSERYDEYITRAEFAHLMVNMMGQQNVAKSLEGETYFTDISNSEYAGDINLLYKLNIVGGLGGGIFNPDGYVKYAEACKMFVCALGYDKIVYENSLDSYAYTAGVIGVSKYVDSSNEYVKIKDVLIMIDNCLDIGKMIPMYYNDDIAPSYTVDEDATFRYDILHSNPKGFAKMRGIVTADVSSYLYTFNKSLKNTQIEISGKVFDYNGVAPLGYVGMEVEFYVSTIDNDFNKIESLRVTDKNYITEVEGINIASYNDNEIKYYVTEDTTKKVFVDDSTIWIYNNNVNVDFKLDTVNLDGNTNLKFIDNNEDEVADVVYVFEYTDCIVESINNESETVTLKQGYFYKNEKHLCFNYDETKAYVEYYNSNGEQTDFSEIREGSVLSIAKSIDGYSVRVVVCNETAQGLLETKDSDYAVIGTCEIYAGDFDISNMKIGFNYTYKLNFKGSLVYVDEIINSGNYGYVYGMAEKNMGDVVVKMIIPDVTATKTIQGDYDEDNNTSTSTTNLYLKNSNILTCYMAPKFTYEHWTTDSKGNFVLRSETLKTNVENISKFANSPIEYELDINGKIKKISLPKEGTVGYRLNYNSAENIFAKSYGQPFGIDENTFALCIPTNSDASEDDILNYIQELKNSTTYYVDSYDVDEDTLIAGLILIETEMISGTAGNVSSYRNYSGIVVKQAEVYDKETETEKICVTILTKGNQSSICEQTFVVSPLIANADKFKTLSKGDFIAFALDGFDRLNRFELLHGIDNWYDRTDGVGGRNHFCGKVTDIDYKRISNAKGRWMDLLTVENSNGIKTYELIHNKSLRPAVYILDSKGNAKLGDITDIGFNDTVYIFAEGVDVYSVIISR